jgi:hypothetical protein
MSTSSSTTTSSSSATSADADGGSILAAVRRLLPRPGSLRTPAPPPPPADEALGGWEVVLEGALAKRGRWNPGFRTRHFVLTRAGTLLYFAAAADRPAAAGTAGGGGGRGQPLGFVPLGSEVVSAEARAAGEGDGYALLELAVAGPGIRRTYVLGAASRAARDEWLHVLRAAVARRPALMC